MLSLPGGNWLMGYGGLPNFTEYDSSGHVLLDGTLGKNVQDFRTYLSPWSGQPHSSPASSPRRAPGHDRGTVELERRHRSRLLARARRRLAQRARAAVATRREDGLRDDDHRARRGSLRAVQALDAAAT